MLDTNAHQPATVASLHPSLTDRERLALDRLLPVLYQVAEDDAIPIQRIEVERFSDPDEDNDELVITQWVDAPPDAAFALWDKQGASVEVLYQSLPPASARCIREHIALEVRWTEEHGEAKPSGDDKSAL